MYKSRHTHTDNMNNNYSTVSNGIYSSRGPVGRPLYPQLSGHCNRPFPRDSRVFTRRLTPNLVCSRSHTESTSKSYKSTITTVTSRQTIQHKKNNYAKSHDASRSQDNMPCRSIHRLNKGVPKYRRQKYDGTCIHRLSKTQTTRGYIHQAKTFPVQATVVHTSIQGRVRTEDVKHNYSAANV